MDQQRHGIIKPVAQLTDADFDEMMLVNVKSALYGIQAVLPHFQARDAGHLINVSSFLGRVPMATIRSAYSAAKAALNSLTANVRMDLREAYPGIHVSLVMPGIVDTEFARNAVGATPQTRLGTTTPAQSPEDVAAVIVALIHEPKAEVYTNPRLHQTVLRYYEDVGAFEAGAGRPS